MKAQLCLDDTFLDEIDVANRFREGCYMVSALFNVTCAVIEQEMEQELESKEGGQLGVYISDTSITRTKLTECQLICG